VTHLATGGGAAGEARDHGFRARDVVFKPELVVRATTAPPSIPLPRVFANG